jgi:hypothetical protein
MSVNLQIVSFDVPYPPDYGGVVDVFYKIKNLYEAGVKIYLHCFEYGRGMQPELERYCEQVYYYKRKSGISGISLTVPYMVYSRRDDQLLQRLAALPFPILFEGVHTTYYLNHPLLKQHITIIRNQNLEQDYFAQLARRSNRLVSKLYYTLEAQLLRRKEARLHRANAFFTVAEHDYLFFKNKYPDRVHAYIPSFQPYNEVDTEEGRGNYVLYHGNLGHPENRDSAMYLLRQVCPLLPDVPFIFAGKDPQSDLTDGCAALPQVQLIANPGPEQMKNLVAGAQVHALPTAQATGLKLKLLHALFHGRHVVVNEAMVAGTGLDQACHIASSPELFAAGIRELMSSPFTAADIEKRKALLLQRYNNVENARRIVTFLQQ